MTLVDTPCLAAAPARTHAKICAPIVMSALCCCGVLAAAVLIWAALAEWLPAGAERFYLLVPPTFLGVFLAWSSPGKIARPARFVAMTLGFTLFFGYLALCLMTQVLVVPGPVLVEMCCVGYFLMSVGIVLAGLYWIVRGLVRSLARRLRLRAVLADGMARVVVGALALPYLFSLTYVHRFKLASYSNPMETYQRAYQDVAFRTRDHLTLRGWFVPAREPSPRTLFICHGLGGNRELALGYLEVADHIQANAFLFDFRGHGASDGHTVSLGLREKEDVLAAIAYLRSKHPDQARTLVGLGVSMGSGALVLAAAELDKPLDALILDSGMANALDLTDNLLPLVPNGVRPWFIGLGVQLASWHAGCALADLRPEHHIARVRAPALIIHSQGDGLIPADHGRRLYDKATGPKEIFLAPTRCHADVYNVLRPEYLRRVAALLIRDESSFPAELKKRPEFKKLLREK